MRLLVFNQAEGFGLVPPLRAAHNGADLHTTSATPYADALRGLRLGRKAPRACTTGPRHVAAQALLDLIEVQELVVRRTHDRDSAPGDLLAAPRRRRPLTQHAPEDVTPLPKTSSRPPRTQRPPLRGLERCRGS